MKNSFNFRRISLAASFVVAMTLAAAPVSVIAQEKGGAKMLGISPAGAQVTTATAPSAMNCPKCKDVNVTIADASRKGPMAAPTVIQSHQCGSCATKVATVGQGKQATDQVVHECTMSKAADSSCCSMKKTGEQAPAMGQCPMHHE